MSETFNTGLLFSPALASKNNELMNLYFRLNKRLDAFVNYLLVDLNMDNLSEYLHTNYAHGAAGHADSFSDYNAIYSFRSIYNTIPGESGSYENIMDGINDVCDLLVDIDNQLAEAIKLGKEEENMNYINFIYGEYNYLTKFEKQFIMLHDKVSKALACGNSVVDIENNYEKYVLEI